MFVPFSQLKLLTLFLLFKGAYSDLQAYGCDEGWTNHGEHCYLLVGSNAGADSARLSCQAMGSSLASVWSQVEKDFILSLWRYPAEQISFLWIGLRGTSDGLWSYDDSSLFKKTSVTWTILDGVSGVPVATPQKCIALRNSGSVAFLDCVMAADAFVCKKALPKVFVTASLLNHTGPIPTNPLGHAQLFERMYPPVLRFLPGSGSYLTDTLVTTEVGCAFTCFSLSGCQVFQVSCNTLTKCEDFKCTLFSDFTV
ncbi:snaclec crotocetin-like [Biomphalaria glabrata]|uniref:Snaclec crotocetin-like n=1 Tax=Biomphalaria glabrata TaxID=6526 RepID=A0A9W3AJC3_BIOGL|nr:snaclec crotocetin-like [Biomphalaria glabrata]